MHQPVEYDTFADIYDVWVELAPITRRNLPFYVDEYVRTAGPVVELGVGTGRIAIEAARQGKAVIGVDSSSEMLKLCQEQAEAAGVAHLLDLVRADLCDFVLSEPAQLISIPFHTIGHVVTLEDKAAALRHIYTQLAPGGRLVFDHFVFDPEAARRYSGVNLRHEYTDAKTGHDLLLWMITRYDFTAQTMRIVVWTDELDDDGVLIGRQYRRLSFSWLEPGQARSLLKQAGFEIETLYGDFDRRPFTPDSAEQIWVARRPTLGAQGK
jgi:SAM-dependent methyltransferase